MVDNLKHDNLRLDYQLAQGALNSERVKIMKFSQLPIEVQNAVKTELKTVKADFINHQCRYFAKYGYTSAKQYREFLEQSTFNANASTMASVVKHVLAQLLKSGKDYLYVLPANTAEKMRENMMLSKAEFLRKVQ